MCPSLSHNPVHVLQQQLVERVNMASDGAIEKEYEFISVHLFCASWLHDYIKYVLSCLLISLEFVLDH